MTLNIIQLFPSTSSCPHGYKLSPHQLASLLFLPQDRCLPAHPHLNTCGLQMASSLASSKCGLFILFNKSRKRARISFRLFSYKFCFMNLKFLLFFIICNMYYQNTIILSQQQMKGMYECLLQIYMDDQVPVL